MNELALDGVALALCACLASACGGSTPGNAVNGTLNGKPFVAAQALSLVASSGAGVFAGAAAVELYERAGACADASRDEVHNLQRALTISFADVSAAHVATAPTAPGTYVAGDPSAARQAQVLYTESDASCTVDSASLAVSGSVTLSTAAAGVWTGTFDVTLHNGDRVTGSFAPTACPGLKDWLYPTCIGDGAPAPPTLGPPPAGFELLNEQVHQLPLSLKQAAVDQFWGTLVSLPFFEGSTSADLAWRGTASSVTVAGDLNNWDATVSPLVHLEGTDLWWNAFPLEADARLDYKLVTDSTFVLDPMNPRTVAGGLGANSELRMPGYTAPPELTPDPTVPKGTLAGFDVASTFLGNSRTVHVYLPPSYSTGTQSYPWVLFHDGADFLSLAGANVTLDNLIHEGKIREVIGIFVPPVNRADEYIGVQQDAFVSFIGQELLPLLRGKYRLLDGAANAATVGISNGGDVSQYLGLKLSSTFGNVGCLSAAGSFPQSLNGYLASPMLGQTFYMDAGTYDLPGFLQGTGTFVDEVLVAKGYPHEFHTWHEGHSWGSWKAHVILALELFFPGPG